MYLTDVCVRYKCPKCKADVMVYCGSIRHTLKSIGNVTIKNCNHCFTKYTVLKVSAKMHKDWRDYGV
jgi:hypothetical protein